VTPPRSRGRELTFAVWMLASVAAAVALRDVTFCIAGGVMGLAVRLVAARGTWTPSGRFGVANAITLARLALVASLGTLFPLMPRLAFTGVVLAVFLLDGLDGRVARDRGEESAFGAAFDMETDALSAMVLGLILWQSGIVPAWVLIAGLWRYVYAFFIALVPTLGEAPRSRFGRIIYTALMLSLTAAFLPLPTLASTTLAALGTALVSLSFLLSLRHSRAFAR
jgi:phosphatidylglycerophosphate synthase